MTVALVSPVPRQRVFTPLSVVAPGAQYYFYVAGTSTPATTWSHADLATIHENTFPIVADAAGLFGPVYLAFGVQYDVILKDQNGNTLWSQPNVGNGGTEASPVYSVVAYGAVGNGSTDDAAAFQAALDAIKASGLPGTLYIPNGTYKIIGQLTYNDGPALRVQGASRTGAVIQWTDTATRGFSIDSTAASQTSNFTANGQVGDRIVSVADGTKATVGGWVFLDDTQTRGGTLLTRVLSVSSNDVTLEDALPCQLLTASGANAKFYSATALLRGIEFHDVSLTCVSEAPTNKLTLLLLSRCTRFWVDNCTFDGSTGPLLTTRQTYNSRITNSSFTHGVTVAGSGVENQTATGLLVQGNDVRMCQFGIVFSASPYCRTEGNRVSGRATSVALGRGIKYQDSSNFGVISGNNISDCNLYGIYLQDDAFCTVNGNTVSFCGVDPAEHGIQVGGFEPDFCHHNVISNNVVRGCSGYGVAIAPTATVETDLYNVVIGNSLSKNVQGGVVLFHAARCQVIGNNISAPGATVVAGLIYVQSTGAGRNVIYGNLLENEDTTLVPGITTTNGTLGQNTMGANQIGAYLSMVTSDTDLIWNFSGQVNTTETATGANTNETTAVDWTIKGNTIQPRRGFYARGVYTFAANGNNKSLKVYVGTASVAQTPAAVNDEQVTVEIEAIMISSNLVRFYVNILRSGISGPPTVQLAGTFTNSTDDWTADQHVKVTMTNGSSSAGDITHRMSKLTYT